MPNTLQGFPVARTLLPPEPQGTRQTRPDVPRQRNVGRSPAREPLRAGASSVSAPGGRVPLGPGDGGESEGGRGPYHSPPGGNRAAPSRALKGGADLRRKAATHTPTYTCGGGNARVAQGQPGASVYQGEGPKECLLFKLRKF